MARNEIVEEIGFELEGNYFVCKPNISPLFVLRYIKMLGNDNASTAAEVLLDFFERQMDEDEHARFEKVCDDPNTRVEVQRLGEIVLELIGAYGKRPTKPSEG